MVERVLQLIEERGITAYKLTTDLGLRTGAVTEWRQGKSKPSTDAIIKIAKYFDVPTDHLLLGDEARFRGGATMRLDKTFVKKSLGSIILELGEAPLSETLGVTIEELNNHWRDGNRWSLDDLLKIHGLYQSQSKSVPSHFRDLLVEASGSIKSFLFRGSDLEVEVEAVNDSSLLIIPDELSGVKVAAYGGSDWTQDEVDKIAEFARFVRGQQGKE